MSDVLDEILPLAQQGYCCSQILVKLILDAQMEDNPGLMRAMFGLCKGMAGHQGVCGLLTGGMCALAYVTGKGGETEIQHPMDAVIRLEYMSWFAGLAAGYGGVNCSEILGACGEFETGPCKDLLAQCWEKIVELFDQYGIDPAQPKG